MNCTQARALLTTTAAGELSPDQHHALHHHLQTCHSCRRTHAAIAQIDLLVSGWGDSAPVRGYPTARSAIQHKIRQSRLPRFQSREVKLPVLLTSAAVALVLLLLMVLPQGAPSAAIVRPVFTRPVPAAPVVVSGADRIEADCQTRAEQAGSGAQRVIRCQVTYTLDSSDTGIVSLQLVGGPIGHQRFYLEPVIVVRGTAQHTFAATVELDYLHATLGTAPLSIEAVLRASDTTLLARSRVPEGTDTLLTP